MKNRITTKVVLITGISSGFGYALAKRLVKGSYCIYGTVRKKVDPIPEVNYLYMDVTSDESIQHAVDDLLQKEGRLDVLINNAGTGILAPIEFTPIADIQKLMDVNFLGSVRVIQAVLPVMRKQRNGQIITISSIGGLMGLPYQGFYSASKFALEGFCQALHHEIKQFNIKVLVINPGDFSTSFTNNRLPLERDDAVLTYPDFLQTFKQIEEEEKNGLQPDILAKQVEKLISKKNKPFRKTIASPLQKLAVGLKNMLPEKLFLLIIGNYYLPD